MVKRAEGLALGVKLCVAVELTSPTVLVGEREANIVVDADDEPTRIMVRVARGLIDTTLLAVASTAVGDDKEEDDGSGEKDIEGEAVPVRDD